MNTNTWSAEDRTQLLTILRQFRQEREDPQYDYSNRDEIEQKLQEGREIDHSDQYVLKMAIDNQLEFNEQWQHLTEVIGYRLPE